MLVQALEGGRSVGPLKANLRIEAIAAFAFVAVVAAVIVGIVEVVAIVVIERSLDLLKGQLSQVAV